MTTLQQIKLRCPVCETHFASLAGGTSSAARTRRSDFRNDGPGRSTLPYLVHVCVCCGYAGHAEQFDPSVEITPEVRERVWSELAPKLPAVPSMLLLPNAGSEKYEAAAKVAQWQQADARYVAELWLRGAWCCEDEGDTEAERYFRRKAAWSFDQALDSYDGIAREERAAIAYLVGELWRRIGDDAQAAEWFARVPYEVVDEQSQEYIVAVARRQADQPEEWLP